MSSYKVYEDDNFLAFLDIHPQTPGHVQVVPKEHYRWVWQVPNAGEYFEVAKKVALAQQKVFDTEMILCRITGEDVEHAHIWVFPSNKGEGTKNDFETNAKLLSQAMSH